MLQFCLCYNNFLAQHHSDGKYFLKYRKKQLCNCRLWIVFYENFVLNFAKEGTGAASDSVQGCARAVAARTSVNRKRHTARGMIGMTARVWAPTSSSRYHTSQRQHAGHALAKIRTLGTDSRKKTAGAVGALITSRRSRGSKKSRSRRSKNQLQSPRLWQNCHPHVLYTAVSAQLCLIWL